MFNKHYKLSYFTHTEYWCNTCFHLYKASLLPFTQSTKYIFLIYFHIIQKKNNSEIVFCSSYISPANLPVLVKHMRDCWSKIPTWHCSTATVLPFSHTTYHGVCFLPGYSLAPSGWVRQLTWLQAGQPAPIHWLWIYSPVMSQQNWLLLLIGIYLYICSSLFSFLFAEKGTNV